MEYLTNIKDFDLSKVKVFRVDPLYDLTILVSTDNKVLFSGRTYNAHGVVEFAYSLFRISDYLKDNKDTREWLSKHTDFPKEEVDNYTLTTEKLEKYVLDKRSKKAIESKKKVLRKLMAEFPEFVKEVLEQNGN